MGYSILVWDDYGQGKNMIDPYIYVEGVDVFGNPKNWFQFDQLTDEEIIEKHDLQGYHYRVLR